MHFLKTTGGIKGGTECQLLVKPWQASHTAAANIHTVGVTLKARYPCTCVCVFWFFFLCVFFPHVGVNPLQVTRWAQGAERKWKGSRWWLRCSTVHPQVLPSRTHAHKRARWWETLHHIIFLQSFPGSQVLEDLFPVGLIRAGDDDITWNSPLEFQNNLFDGNSDFRKTRHNPCESK